MASPRALLIFMTWCLALTHASKVYAQLTVSGAMTPQQLVQNVLLGPGVTASNITFTGTPIAVGSFTNGQSTNLGIPNGILLTSGTITNAPGPNNQTGASSANSLPGDPDLDAIMSPTLSYDASIIEFDFVPNGDTLKFRYVFGSDEYMEYVSPTPGGINDGFGFFLSGVSVPMPVTNIAVVPNTTTPITMFNVNCSNGSPYYICNDPNNFICPATYSCPTSTAATTIQYDGFTTVLTAVSPVICGETYHIKIAIGDGGDGIIDSGVFLEAGSFASPSTVQISADVNFGGNDTVMYEGCSQATIVFDRGTASISSADTLYYTVTGSGTNGTDYSYIPDSVYFPPGVDTAFINVNALLDNLSEGTETITITATFVNPCNNQTTVSTVTLYIVDALPLTVTASNDTFITCPGEVIPLSAQAAGGVGIGNYNYSWSPAGGTAAAISVAPTQTTTYTVTATDSCGLVQAIDSVKITVLPYTYPQVTAASQTICLGESIDLVSVISGGLPQYTITWTGAAGVISGNDTISLTPSATSTYTVTVSDYCNNTATASPSVTVSTTTAAFDYSYQTNAEIAFLDQSALDVVTWSWDFGDGESGVLVENPIHMYGDTGTYTVTLIVTNAAGCIDTVDTDVVVLPDMYFYFPNAFTPNGDGKNDVFTAYGLGVEKYELLIFNRWGDLVYQTDDMTKGWDGKTKSGPAQEEVYICVFNIEGDVDGVNKKIKHIGKVSLIR